MEQFHHFGTVFVKEDSSTRSGQNTCGEGHTRSHIRTGARFTKYLIIGVSSVYRNIDYTIVTYNVLRFLLGIPII